jgi:hypothetical protein
MFSNGKSRGYMVCGHISHGCGNVWNSVIWVITYDHDRSGGVKTVSLFSIARGHMTLIRPGVRRLGAGAPLTVLWFASLARLRPVVGFHAIYCMCARFIQEGCVL